MDRKRSLKGEQKWQCNMLRSNLPVLASGVMARSSEPHFALSSDIGGLSLPVSAGNDH